MAEIISIPDILSLGSSVTITFGFLIYLRLMMKDHRKERDASERRYAELLKDNTEARRADHENRNKETEAILLLNESVKVLNQNSGATQKQCTDNVYRFERIAERIEECPIIHPLKEDKK